LSGSTSTLTILGVTTRDSQSVTVDYRIDGANSGSSLDFGIYRSSDAQFDANDVPVGPLQTISADARDDSGRPISSTGSHKLTIGVEGGLPLDPTHPYVVVVAQPPGAGVAVEAPQSASFRTRIIGVVTHGGLINTSWKNGPPWQLQIAALMRQQGYDAVIPFNWVQQSGNAGAASRQSGRLVHQVLKAAAGFDPSEVVDLHFVGHSEGAIVNTMAIAQLGREATPSIQAGYIEDTLLDPHAANNSVPGRDFSTSGLLGSLADALITGYQGDARDPQAFIPANVDQAQVFYQHTKAKDDHGVNGGIYNLWGQVPVSGPGTAHYYNLTPAGATHSGNTGVALWYRNFVATTLAEQTPLIRELELDGQLDDAAENESSRSVSDAAATRATVRQGNARSLPRRSPGFARTRGSRAGDTSRLVTTSSARFSGTAAPGSQVRVYLGPAADPSTIGLAGLTRADAAGHWSISTRRLSDGRYRAVAASFSRALHNRPGLTVVPTAPLGGFTVLTRSPRATG
jgi:hypothetical protein